jgi:hypothetical protein
LKTLSLVEIKQWCGEMSVALDQQGYPCRTGPMNQGLRFRVPSETGRLLWLSRLIEATLRPRDRCLLWITTWSIWASGENWHLYYSLKKSYGDSRLLEEAPGHLFLDYEVPDLVSYLQLGLIAGWDMHLLPTNFDGRAFISHDGWLEFFLNDAIELTTLRKTLVDSGLEPL